MAVANPCNVPIAPELTLPLMLGSTPTPTSITHLESTVCPEVCATAAPANMRNPIVKSPGIARRVGIPIPPSRLGYGKSVAVLSPVSSSEIRHECAGLAIPGHGQ